MTLNFVQISGTFEDGTGAALSGTASFTANTAVYAGGIPVLAPDSPVQAEITAGQLRAAGGGALQLLATDNPGLSFVGQTGFLLYTVSVTLGGETLPPWQFFLPHSTLGNGPVDLYSLADTAAAAGGITPPAGDLGGTAPDPTVVSTHLSAPLPLAQGGTGQDAANAAALLSALGALPEAGGTMTGALAPAVAALSQSAGSVAVNAQAANVFTLTLTASGWTIANPSDPADGQVIRVRLTQDGTGSRTVSWGSAYDWGSGNSAPTLSTAAGVTDVLAFEYLAGPAKWAYLGAAVPQGF